VAGTCVPSWIRSGTRDDWKDEADRFAAVGVATLSYDKPGVGGSEGDWTSQSFDDRAREALCAVRSLQDTAGIESTCVGLLGGSQGGWIAPMAAARSAQVAFVVTLSAAGVSPRDQDLFRLDRQLRRIGLGEAEIDEALVAWHIADDDLRQGRAPVAIVERQRAFRERRWYSYMVFDDVAVVGFIEQIWRFDPVPYLERCRCPLLAMWGEEADLVPVRSSREIFDRALRKARNNRVSLRVFAGADHDLRSLGDGKEIAGLVELIANWIEEAVGEGVHATA